MGGATLAVDDKSLDFNNLKSKPQDFNDSKTPIRKPKGSTDKGGKKPHSNAGYSSDDFDSEDIEIKIQ